MSDKVAEKAKRYLTDGKVTVVCRETNTAIVTVQGSGSNPYTVDYGGTHWTCDCPAYIECAHIVAAQLIIPLRNTSAPPKLGTPEQDITNYLNQFINKD